MNSNDNMTDDHNNTDNNNTANINSNNMDDNDDNGNVQDNLSGVCIVNFMCQLIDTEINI